MTALCARQNFKGHEKSRRSINSSNAFPLIWKHEYHFSTTGDRSHRKNRVFFAVFDRYWYQFTGLANTKGIQTVIGQSFPRNSATRNLFGSTVMSESCLIGVNNYLKFTDKNEINKMFITVNTAAPRAAIECTIVSFTLGRGGILRRNGVFV